MNGRFVVQEHHSRWMHFDIRLEVNGAAKSWMIPKGPSMNPNERRLAVVPRERCGFGKALLWDQGDLVAAMDIERFLEKGWLVFTLRGRRLRGQFMIERWSNNDLNWSLYKLRDEYADGDFVLAPNRKVRGIRDYLPLFEGVAV